MRALARSLQAVERMLADRGDDYDSALVEPVAEASALHLLGVKRGSARYPIAAESRDRAVEVLRLAGHGIRAPLKHDWTIGELAAIEELSAVAKSLGCVIELRSVIEGGGRRLGDVLARIEPNTYAAIAAGVFVRGESDTLARVERVGGATEMRCGLRLPNQPERMVFCTVENASVVRQLGQFVYQDVTVAGEFTWIRPTWKIRHILVRSVAHHGTEDRDRAMAELKRVASVPWSKIADPTAFIQSLRCG